MQRNLMPAKERLLAFLVARPRFGDVEEHPAEQLANSSFNAIICAARSMAAPTITIDVSGEDGDWTDPPDAVRSARLKSMHRFQAGFSPYVRTASSTIRAARTNMAITRYML